MIRWLVYYKYGKEQKSQQVEAETQGERGREGEI